MREPVLCSELLLARLSAPAPWQAAPEVQRLTPERTRALTKERAARSVVQTVPLSAQAEEQAVPEAQRLMTKRTRALMKERAVPLSAQAVERAAPGAVSAATEAALPSALLPAQAETAVRRSMPMRTRALMKQQAVRSAAQTGPLSERERAAPQAQRSTRKRTRA